MGLRQVRLFTLSLILLLLAGLSPLAGQTPQVPVDPREFGLDLPTAPPRPGQGIWLTRTAGGEEVVVRQHVVVGDHAIVMFPDGRLTTRPLSELQPTERPFQAISKDELAEQLTREGPLAGMKARQTRHYLFIYNTSERFALATSRILETMFPGVVAHARAQRIATNDPDVPLVVVLFRSQEQFQQFREMPPDVMAYYDVVSNRVVLYEEGEIGQQRPDLAVQQAVATIAHEGTHQILHNIGVQQRLSVWPMWLSEGLAEFLAPTTIGRGLRWKGAGQVNDLRMFELEEFVKFNSGKPAPGHLVMQTVTAARLTSTGYASAWALTHYLAKNRRREFYEYVNEVSRLGPLQRSGRVVPPGLVPDNLALFAKHFGDDMAEHEQRLLKHLDSLPYQDPFALLPHFVALVAVPAPQGVRREAQSFHSKRLAEQWRRGVIEQIPEAQREAAQSAIREFPNRVLADRFAQQWRRGS